MADISIILNNVGNDRYAQVSRELIGNPIITNLMKVLLTTESQVNNIIQIRNERSFGAESNRDISLRNFVDALNKTGLIVDVPLDPPVILDGQTFFQTVLEANSEIDLLFYFDQVEVSGFLT